MVNCAQFLLNSGVCSIIAIQLLNVLSQSRFSMHEHHLFWCTEGIRNALNKMMEGH